MKKNILVVVLLLLACSAAFAFRGAGGGARGGGGRMGGGHMGGARTGGGARLGGGQARSAGFAGRSQAGMGRQQFSRPTGRYQGGGQRSWTGAGMQQRGAFAGGQGMRPGFSSGAQYGYRQGMQGRPMQSFRPGQAGQGQMRPGGRPGTRPGQGLRPDGRPGQGLRPGGRPGQGVRPGQRPGRLDPNKTGRWDQNRNRGRLDQQKNFMNRRFDKNHDFGSLYRGNYRRFMGLFPFAFYRQYGYYPPIYYDYYDQNGVYPEEDPNYDAYATGAMPLDYESPQMGLEPMPGMMGPYDMYPADVPYYPETGAFVDYAGESPLYKEQVGIAPQSMADENMLAGDVASALDQDAGCLSSCAKDCKLRCSQNSLISPDICDQQCASICSQQCQEAQPVSAE